MQKLVWQNANGVELDLTSGNYGITEWEGFSNASLNIQSQQVPFQDGGVFLDALIEQRELSVTLAMQDNNNLELRYQNRRELISALNPKLGEGYLIYTNDFISKRIKCVPQIPLFETHNSDTVGTPKASLSWTACEPYWEDLEDNNVDFNYGEIPEIENDGDIKTQVKIEIFTQGVKDPAIINMDTNQKVKYQGELENNLVINTNFGEKKVINESMTYDVLQDVATINRFCYAINLSIYVAVYNGGIYYSYDAKKWGKEYLKLSVRNVAYSESKRLFVAVGPEDFYYTSKNGIDWEKRSTPLSNNGLYKCVIFIEDVGKFFITNNSSLYESEDGINWTRLLNVSGLYLPAAAIYDEVNHIFLIGNYNGTIVKTTDFETWEIITASANSHNINDIIIAENKYFCFCSEEILVSSDLETWLSIVPDIPEGYESLYINCGVYNKNTMRFLVGAQLYKEGQSKSAEIKSEDGVNWVVVATPDKNIIKSNIFVEVTDVILQGSEVGDIYLSTNMQDWENENKKEIDGILKSVCYSEEKKLFVGVTTDKIYISKDGIHWNQSMYEGLGTPYPYYNVFYLKKTKQFRIGGNYILLSYDGINWEKNSTLNPDTQYDRKIIYAEKLGFYYKLDTSGNGGLLKSEDGINWTRIYNTEYNINQDLIDVAYSEKKNILVIVGLNKICRSLDGGVTWSEDAGETGKAITYSEYNDIFVKMSGDDNSIAIKTSMDGEIWTTQSEVTGNIVYRSLCYAKGLSLFFSPLGTNISKVIISSDGKDWKEITLPFNTFFIDSYTGDVVVSNILKRFVFFSPSSSSNSTSLYYTTLKEGDNEISKLSSDTDMTFYLKTGINKIRIQKEDGNFSCRISYRQKYIGV